MHPASKLRMTTQRRVILEELMKLKTHPTAGDLCQIVRRRLPRISLGTVYRNLEILSREGVIQKLDVGGVEMRFDGNIDNHYHLRCINCGRVDDAELDLVESLDRDMSVRTDYDIVAHRLEFVGYCPDCKQAAAVN